MRYSIRVGSSGVFVALAALFLGPDVGRGQTADNLMPHWQVGQRWTIETVSRPLHIRAAPGATAASSPLRWQFHVVGEENLLAHDCFRVEVTCQLHGREIPKTVLWLDADSRALRKITTHLPTPGGFQPMTIHYDSTSDQPAPIVGPLSALPIDTPVLYSGAKGLQTFSYTSHSGPTEQKELGDVGFAHQIEQQVAELPQDTVRELFAAHFAKSLVDDPFAKSLTTRPVTEVKLKSQGRQIRQLWQPQRPWPIYCDNGYTVSRLVSVAAPAQATDKEDRQ